MTLEAALQYTGEQLIPILKPHTPKGENPFAYWLRKRRVHNRYMRGLRTLRHFAAHVEIKPVRRGVNICAEKSVEARPGWHRVTESTISHQSVVSRILSSAPCEIVGQAAGLREFFQFLQGNQDLRKFGTVPPEQAAQIQD
jgi:hypothetical protein